MPGYAQVVPEAQPTPAGVARGRPDGPEDLYLDLLKRTLSRANARPETLVEVSPDRALSRAAFRALRPLLGRRGIRLMRARAINLEGIDLGLVAHPDAETMIGMRRLDNLHELVLDVLRTGVPGDLVETGIWRGGATILMRGILKAYGVTDRVVWAADSFEGLPAPDPGRYPADAGVPMWSEEGWTIDLTAPIDEVRENFARYGLLDDQVRFLPGWFRDTLPSAPINRISVLRLDGDLYESTIQALEALYPKVSVGGFVIVDDYGAWEPCRKATDAYRAANHIEDEIRWIDWTGAYWQKSGEVTGGDASG